MAWLRLALDELDDTALELVLAATDGAGDTLVGDVRRHAAARKVPMLGALRDLAAGGALAPAPPRAALAPGAKRAPPSRCRRPKRRSWATWPARCARCA